MASVRTRTASSVRSEVSRSSECLVLSCLQQLDERRVPVGGADFVEGARERVGIARHRLDVAAGGHKIVEMGLERGGVALHERDGRRLEEHAIAVLALSQRLLGALALRGVDPGRHDLPQDTVLVEDGAIAPGHPHALAVAAHVLVLVREVALGMAEDVIHQVGEIAPAGLRARHDGADDRPAGELAQRVAEEILPVLVEIDDAALGIPAQHDAVDVPHQLALLRHRRGQVPHRLAQDGGLGAQAVELGARLRVRGVRRHGLGQGRYTPARVRWARAVLSGARTDLDASR